jgi:hypothetical protein
MGGLRAAMAAVCAPRTLLLLLGVLASASGGGDGSTFLHPLHPNDAQGRNLTTVWVGAVNYSVPFHLLRTPFKDVLEVIADKYEAVERKWRGQAPLLAGELHDSPPASVAAATGERGQLAERRDYTINLQPGAAPFSETPDGVPGGGPADGRRGGNFCDEGSLDTRCVVRSALVFPGNYPPPPPPPSLPY